MIVAQPSGAPASAPERTPEFGSDLVVDVLRALGIEYAAFNPGASFRGLHDSLVNYGGDTSPRSLLCCHEEISVALAHGYAKATGRPMVAALHDVVGLQHACMAIFNAWCDRVPVLLLGGTGPMDSTRRRPWIEWIHTALVQGNHVRDFVKFDDQPSSAAALSESLLRAYRLMSSEPCGPVYVCLDAAIQEDPLPKGISVPTDIDRWIRQSPVQADPAGLETAAHWLSESQRPVILADTVGRSREGSDALKALAEKLQAPVIDLGARYNFPSEHPLEATERREELLREADVILAVDVVDLWGALQANAARHRPAGYAPSPAARLISLSVSPLLVRSWTSDFQRMQPVDLNLVGDSRLALPALVELVRGASEDRKARAEVIAADGRRRRAEWEDRARALTLTSKGDGAVAWGALGLALRDALVGQDVVLSNSDLRGWARRLWRIDQPYQYTGTAGGAGLGYGIGASLGVGLAHKGSGRIVLDLQPDGDFMYSASALYTAAHEKLPLLIVMLNNHSYYNSEEHGLRMAEHRGRPAERAGIGTRPEVRLPDEAPRPLGPVELADALSESLLVPQLESLAEIAAPYRDLAPFEAARQLMSRVYCDFEYQPGVTDVTTSVAHVLEGRRGVCQDFAHLLIGLCRALALPTRYVSGYILTGDKTSDPSRGGGASHAWAEVFTPSHGWRGFDPTNNLVANDRYVKIATGRDYHDVPPTRGTYHGASPGKLVVSVVTQPLD